MNTEHVYRKHLSSDDQPKGRDYDWTKYKFPGVSKKLGDIQDPNATSSTPQWYDYKEPKFPTEAK